MGEHFAKSLKVSSKRKVWRKLHFMQLKVSHTSEYNLQCLHKMLEVLGSYPLYSLQNKHLVIVTLLLFQI